MVSEAIVDKSARATSQGSDSRASSAARQRADRRTGARATQHNSGGLFAGPPVMAMMVIIAIDDRSGRSWRIGLLLFLRRRGLRLRRLRLRWLSNFGWAHHHRRRNQRFIAIVVGNHRLRQAGSHEQSFND